MQTNNFLNQKFDLILFDEGDEEGYKCYVKAVTSRNWDANCNFKEKTRIFKNTDTFSDFWDGLDQIDELSGRIIIDNTPFPLDGASSSDSLTAMVTVRTDFEMMYNIKTLTIYCGLACLMLLFILLGQIYLCCKLRRDTNNKRKKIAEEYRDDFSTGSKLIPKTE